MIGLLFTFICVAFFVSIGLADKPSLPLGPVKLSFSAFDSRAFLGLTTALSFLVLLVAKTRTHKQRALAWFSIPLTAFVLYRSGTTPYGPFVAFAEAEQCQAGQTCYPQIHISDRQSVDCSRSTGNSDSEAPLAFQSGDYIRSDPSWSPDRRHIVFAQSLQTGLKQPSDSFRLYVGDVSEAPNWRLSSPVLLLGQTGSAANEPAWSSKNVIAFTQGGEVFLVKTDDTILSSRVDKQLPTKLAVGQRPAWSPDGSLLAFTRSPTATTAEVWVAQVDINSLSIVGQPHLIAGPAKDSEAFGGAAWIDNRTLLLVHDNNTAPAAKPLPQATTDLVSVAVDETGNLTSSPKLVKGSQAAKEVAVSPNEKYVAFTSTLNAPAETLLLANLQKEGTGSFALSGSPWAVSCGAYAFHPSWGATPEPPYKRWLRNWKDPRGIITGTAV